MERKRFTPLYAAVRAWCSTVSLWKHSRQLGAASRSAAAEKTHGTTKHLYFRCSVMETEQLVRRNLLRPVRPNHRRSDRAAEEKKKLRLPCCLQSYSKSASETLPNCTDTSMEENTTTSERVFKGYTERLLPVTI